MIHIKGITKMHLDQFLKFIGSWDDYVKIEESLGNLYDITIYHEVPVRLHFSDHKLLFDIGNRLWWLDKGDYSEVNLY